MPLIAFGSALASAALVLLWRIAWPLAIPAALLLVGTNWLFLGGTLDRFDRDNPWWPPTLCCYMRELCRPFRGGDGELVEMLDGLPAGTTVRIWPSFMVYPPMFYVPRLHYCDQLSEKKPIRAGLRRELPDYLFVEKARPEVVVVPGWSLGVAADYLKRTCGPTRYRVCKALQEPFLYTQKPEIPAHWFWLPAIDWKKQPVVGVVLVAVGSEAEKCLASTTSALDRRHGAYALLATAGQAADGGNLDSVVEYCEAALRLDPGLAAAHVNLGLVCEKRHQAAEALRHYRAAIEAEPANAVAHFDLANMLLAENANDEAERHYREAVAAKPDYAQAHYNLGIMLLRQGRMSEAREHLAAAQQSAAPGTRLADEARLRLRQMPK